MAHRICFLAERNNSHAYREIEVEFQFFSGFSIAQKQRSIKSLHESIRQEYRDLNVLEVSTKSTNPIGVALSAFNLKFFDEGTGIEYPLENVFQSSKVFEHGGPYRDLLYVHPRDAKRDERLQTSGRLINFNLNGEAWELEPKSMFYDWIYMKALQRDESLSSAIQEYDAFTDIEFNHTKSLNCQARAAAIFVNLSRRGILERTLANREELVRLYPGSSKPKILFEKPEEI